MDGVVVDVVAVLVLAVAPHLAEAMRFAFRNLRIVAEPGGAVALAALIGGKAGSLPDETVVVISGGNVDPRLYAEIIG